MNSIPFNINKIRQDFPILQEQVHGKPLVYLDNAATTQKPQIVLDSMQHFYRHDCANIHRAVHTLSERATVAYEGVRSKAQHFLNAASPAEIIFVRGTTEAINLVAQSYGRSHFKYGDEIILSAMEHHSNIVPWQIIAEELGCVLRIIPITDEGEIDLDAYQQLLSERTKMLALVHISNSLGTINPVQKMIKLAHQAGAVVLLDGAQAAAHVPIDVQQLDCDFYTLSGHKLFGPTGIGVLYGKAHLLEAMPPYHGGGDMISHVSFAKSSYREIPHRFEAGTPNIAGTIGLGSALDYLQQFNYQELAAYEQHLLNYATTALQTIPGLSIIGTAKDKIAILSFILHHIHPHDLATILDHDGVAVRAGHHCTMPLMERFKVPATVRASLAFYNTEAEIDTLVASLYRAQEIFN